MIFKILTLLNKALTCGKITLAFSNIAECAILEVVCGLRAVHILHDKMVLKLTVVYFSGQGAAFPDPQQI